jgi:hypothetical protein
MPQSPKLTKKELLQLIDELESQPNDRSEILGKIGVVAVGAGGAGAAAALFGSGVASIPIITALTGFGFPVAAPVALVAGAAVAGGAVMYGAAELIKGSGAWEAKRAALLEDYYSRLKELEQKERTSGLTNQDKTNFYSFLKEPIKFGKISPSEAQELMKAVESGELSLKDAYHLIYSLLEEGDEISSPSSLPENQAKVPSSKTTIVRCTNCSQKLRVPLDRGIGHLTCPRCKNTVEWRP